MLLALQPAMARQAAEINYFPLDGDNQWTYFQVLFPPPDFTPDTLFSGPFTVTETLLLNDTLHYVFPFPFSLADTLSPDEQGRVWAYRAGHRSILFDFTLDDGATYVFEDLLDSQFDHVVTVRKNLTLDTRIGRFENCTELHFDIPGALDAARTYIFAPEVGLIHIVGFMGEVLRLYEARINGVIVTAVGEQADLPASFAVVESYPNPFVLRTTIRLHLPHANQTTITIYDGVGRRVALLLDAKLGPGETDVVWRASQHPSGVYYARIQVGEEIKTLLLVHRR